MSHLQPELNYKLLFNFHLQIICYKFLIIAQKVSHNVSQKYLQCANEHLVFWTSSSIITWRISPGHITIC